MSTEPFGLVISGMAPMFTSAFEQTAPTSWVCKFEGIKASGRNETSMVRGCIFLNQPIDDATKMVSVYATFSYPGQPDGQYQLISKVDNDHPSNTFALKVSKTPQGIPRLNIGLQLEDKKTRVTFTSDFISGGGAVNGNSMGGFSGGAQAQNQRGVVKTWEQGKVVGMIQSQHDGRDYKCHQKNVQGGQAIPPNTQVLFDIGTHQGKPTALNVRPP